MRFLLLIAALFALAPAALAAPSPPPAPQKPLDALFAALSQAQSSEQAKPIEDQILTLFLQSQSPSIDLLMTRAAAALTVGDKVLAGQLFTAVTAIAPDYAEGWHQRARIEAASGNDEAAMISLERTVMLNPREFQACAELGIKLEEYGNKKGALEMYRQALALDPQYDDIARHIRALSRAVEGQGI
ncbi:MAG: hypothetical protein KGR48_10145 [Alphaproteobacteria bacterium]|nr:hypothetical protein [Alphaproteobacteria bacterium]MBU6473402.1 hypothetical protein [Alphaproteobacteria bacterium]MDE2012834.1 hypothetical protein [Alphaproteobacteria bacterium]MDE2073557.1 hypothetical protein [Alphaproteobacteria bacterium]MDE2350530.1 hypothetical protein [Alphaproteobacteria bacterium]